MSSTCSGPLGTSCASGASLAAIDAAAPAHAAATTGVRARVGPVLLEQLAGVDDELAAQVEAEVVPGVVAQRPPGELRRIALEVLGGEVAAAAPQPLGVGDDHLAVVAQVGAAAQDRAERRHELHDLDAGAAQRLHVQPAAEPGADAVDQEAHLDAALGLAAQGLGDLVAEAVGGEDEGADVDRPGGAGDQLEHGGARLGAVGVDAQLAVAGGRRQAHRAAEAARPERGGLGLVGRRPRPPAAPAAAHRAS